MADVMISYARADAAVAEFLATRLASAGFDVWFDRDIPPGETFDRVIDRALRDARKVVVLWSRQSVESRWVVAEAQEAAAMAKLVPARLDDVVVPLEFRRIQTADLIGWRGESKHAGYRSILASLRNRGGAVDSKRAARTERAAAKTSSRDRGHPFRWFLTVALAFAIGVMWWNSQNGSWNTQETQAGSGNTQVTQAGSANAQENGLGDDGGTLPPSTAVPRAGLFDETLLSAPFETSGNFIGESGPGPEIVATRIIEDWLATGGCDGASRGEMVSATSGDPAAVTIDIAMPCADTAESFFPYSGGVRVMLTLSGNDSTWEVTREMFQVYCPHGIERGALCKP